MNTRAIALTALGVGVAVAGAMVALQQKVEPIAEALVVERARARAQATSLSVERAFLRSRRALETVARALSESPAFEELGGGVPDQLRDAEMVGALKDATLQLEGQVRAVLLDGNGAPVVGAAPLAETDAARDAGATGAAVYRLERDERRTREVIAVPLAGGDGAGRPRGLVVLARPMEPIRLAGWAGPSAAQPMFGLFEGGEPLVSLMPPDLSGAVRSTRGQAELQLGEGRRFAVSELDVTPAVGRPVRLVALSALRGPADADVMSNVRGVVVGLGLLAFVIVAAILFLLPDPAPAPAVVAGEARVGPRTHDLVASPSSPLEGRPGDSLAWPRGERSGGHGEGAGGAAPAVGAPSTLPTPEAPEPAQTLRPPPRAASFLSKAAGPIPGTPPPPSPVGFAPSAHAGPPPAPGWRRRSSGGM